MRNSKRPYFSKSNAELAKLFADHKQEDAVVRRITHELEFRNSPPAVKLSKKIEAFQLEQLIAVFERAMGAPQKRRNATIENELRQATEERQRMMARQREKMMRYTVGRGDQIVVRCGTGTRSLSIGTDLTGFETIRPSSKIYENAIGREVGDDISLNDVPMVIQSISKSSGLVVKNAR